MLVFVLSVVMMAGVARAIRTDLARGEVEVHTGTVTDKKVLHQRGTRHKLLLDDRGFTVTSLGIYPHAQPGMQAELHVAPSTRHVLAGRLDQGTWYAADYHYGEQNRT